VVRAHTIKLWGSEVSGV